MFLNVHSYFSLRYGTMSIASLIAEAKSFGIKEIVLTDINNSSGCMPFIMKCREEGIRPLIGIEFRRDGLFLYLGIAKNKEGMKELNDFLSYYNLTEQELPDTPPLFEHAYVVYPFVRFGKTLRTNEYIGVRPTEQNQLFGKDTIAIRNKLLAFNAVTFSGKLQYRFHEYLRGIDLSTLLGKVTVADKCEKTEHFLPAEEIKNLYANYPYLLENTSILLGSCCTDEYKFGDRNNKTIKTFTGSISGDEDLLEKIALAGMVRRYGNENEQALAKIKAELKIVKEMSFCAYFLITWDVISYSRSVRFHHVGRGSGANSTIAYCLGITDVNPIELDLYFERFLNSKRSSPPDFDIDYSWDEREQVQQYLLRRYGAAHTALLGTISTFQGKSVVREIGKVLGLPKAEIDSFTDPTKDKYNQDNPTFKKINALYKLMEGMPNQRSIHAGGILISEEPITYYTALDLPPKGMATVQWDMYVAEAIGLDKFDILSQRGIGHIKEATELIASNKKSYIDIHQVGAFLKDEQLNERLRSGDSIGCFYIESPAMRQLLKKLQCSDYRTLIAASSIIRPGVASSGMMRNYIYYFHHPEEVAYLHPVMKEQLAETYGIMVYQEDVIKVCYHYAGLDLADADVLRRAMSGKYRSSDAFAKLVNKFFEKAKETGRNEKTTEEVWRQISSFAGYSFSKAHSASFAIESYQSLFLKTYYPMEFMVAVLNNYGGFYQRWVYVHELKKTGAKVHLPCVNHSTAKVTIEQEDVYLGLVGIQGLEDYYIDRIPYERKLNGPFLSLTDFIKRMDINLEQGIILIKIGALRFTGFSKKELLWDIHNQLGIKALKKPITELFKLPPKQYQMPELLDEPLEDAYQELELLGYPLTMSMFDLLKTQYRGNILAKDLINHIGKTVKMVGLYVCEKTVRTKRNSKMWFGTFLDVQRDFFDTTHFPNNTPIYPFSGKGCYLILGKVVEDFGFPSIEIEKFTKLPIRDNPFLV